MQGKEAHRRAGAVVVRLAQKAKPQDARVASGSEVRS